MPVHPPSRFARVKLDRVFARAQRGREDAFAPHGKGIAPMAPAASASAPPHVRRRRPESAAFAHGWIGLPRISNPCHLEPPGRPRIDELA